MKIVQSDPYSAHQEVMLLLPWYVNHTLGGAELKQVEEHLGVCLTCKRELLSLQKLALLVNQAGALDTAEQAAFMQLKKRLHQSSPPPVQAAVPEILSLAQHRAVKRPAITPWAPSRPALALAAVLLLSLVVPGYFKLNQMLSNDYRTLSEGGMATSQGNHIHLVFTDNITPAQIEQILAPLKGEIVGKPTEQAVYTVRFKQTQTKEALLNQLAQLKKNPQVVFAEPAYVQLAVPPLGSNLK